MNQYELISININQYESQEWMDDHAGIFSESDPTRMTLVDDGSHVGWC